MASNLESLSNFPSMYLTASFVSGVPTALPVQDARIPIGVIVDPQGLLVPLDYVVDVKIEKASGKPTVTITLASGGTRILGVTIFFSTSNT